MTTPTTALTAASLAAKSVPSPQLKVGKKELLSWAAELTGRHSVLFEDLQYGDLFLELFAHIWPQPMQTRLRKIHRHPQIETAIKQNWNMIELLLRELNLPLAFIDRQAIQQRKFRSCFQALVLLYFLHRLLQNHECSFVLAHPVDARIMQFMAGEAPLLCLASAGSIQLPDEIERELFGSKENAHYSESSKGLISSDKGIRKNVTANRCFPKGDNGSDETAPAQFYKQPSLNTKPLSRSEEPRENGIEDQRFYSGNKGKFGLSATTRASKGNEVIGGGEIWGLLTKTTDLSSDWPSKSGSVECVGDCPLRSQMADEGEDTEGEILWRNKRKGFVNESKVEKAERKMSDQFLLLSSSVANDKHLRPEPMMAGIATLQDSRGNDEKKWNPPANQLSATVGSCCLPRRKEREEMGTNYNGHKDGDDRCDKSEVYDALPVDASKTSTISFPVEEAQAACRQLYEGDKHNTDDDTEMQIQESHRNAQKSTDNRKKYQESKHDKSDTISSPSRQRRADDSHGTLNHHLSTEKSSSAWGVVSRPTPVLTQSSPSTERLECSFVKDSACQTSSVDCPSFCSVSFEEELSAQLDLWLRQPLEWTCAGQKQKGEKLLHLMKDRIDSLQRELARAVEELQLSKKQFSKQLADAEEVRRLEVERVQEQFEGERMKLKERHAEAVRLARLETEAQIRQLEDDIAVDVEALCSSGKSASSSSSPLQYNNRLSGTGGARLMPPAVTPSSLASSKMDLTSFDDTFSSPQEIKMNDTHNNDSLPSHVAPPTSCAAGFEVAAKAALARVKQLQQLMEKRLALRDKVSEDLEANLSELRQQCCEFRFQSESRWIQWKRYSEFQTALTELAERPIIVGSKGCEMSWQHPEFPETLRSQVEGIIQNLKGYPSATGLTLFERQLLKAIVELEMRLQLQRVRDAQQLQQFKRQLLWQGKRREGGQRGRRRRPDEELPGVLMRNEFENERDGTGNDEDDESMGGILEREMELEETVRRLEAHNKRLGRTNEYLRRRFENLEEWTEEARREMEIVGKGGELAETERGTLGEKTVDRLMTVDSTEATTTKAAVVGSPSICQTVTGISKKHLTDDAPENRILERKRRSSFQDETQQEAKTSNSSGISLSPSSSASVSYSSLSSSSVAASSTSSVSFIPNGIVTNLTDAAKLPMTSPADASSCTSVEAMCVSTHDVVPPPYWLPSTLLQPLDEEINRDAELLSLLQTMDTKNGIQNFGPCSGAAAPPETLGVHLASTLTFQRVREKQNRRKENSIQSMHSPCAEGIYISVHVRDHLILLFWQLLGDFYRHRQRLCQSRNQLARLQGEVRRLMAEKHSIDNINQRQLQEAQISFEQQLSRERFNWRKLLGKNKVKLEIYHQRFIYLSEECQRQQLETSKTLAYCNEADGKRFANFLAKFHALDSEKNAMRAREHLWSELAKALTIQLRSPSLENQETLQAIWAHLSGSSHFVSSFTFSIEPRVMPSQHSPLSASLRQVDNFDSNVNSVFLPNSSISSTSTASEINEGCQISPFPVGKAAVGNTRSSSEPKSKKKFLKGGPRNNGKRFSKGQEVIDESLEITDLAQSKENHLSESTPMSLGESVDEMKEMRLLFEKRFTTLPPPSLPFVEMPILMQWRKEDEGKEEMDEYTGGISALGGKTYEECMEEIAKGKVDIEDDQGQRVHCLSELSVPPMSLHSQKAERNKETGEAGEDQKKRKKVNPPKDAQIASDKWAETLTSMADECTAVMKLQIHEKDAQIEKLRNHLEEIQKERNGLREQLYATQAAEHTLTEQQEHLQTQVRTLLEDADVLRQNLRICGEKQRTTEEAWKKDYLSVATTYSELQSLISLLQSHKPTSPTAATIANSASSLLPREALPETLLPPPFVMRHEIHLNTTKTNEEDFSLNNSDSNDMDCRTKLLSHSVKREAIGDVPKNILNDCGPPFTSHSYVDSSEIPPVPFSSSSSHSHHKTMLPSELTQGRRACLRLSDSMTFPQTPPAPSELPQPSSANLVHQRTHVIQSINLDNKHRNSDHDEGQDQHHVVSRDDGLVFESCGSYGSSPRLRCLYIGENTVAPRDECHNYPHSLLGPSTSLKDDVFNSRGLRSRARKTHRCGKQNSFSLATAVEGQDVDPETHREMQEKKPREGNADLAGNKPHQVDDVWTAAMQRKHDMSVRTYQHQLSFEGSTTKVKAHGRGQKEEETDDERDEVKSYEGDGKDAVGNYIDGDTDPEMIFRLSLSEPMNSKRDKEFISADARDPQLFSYCPSVCTEVQRQGTTESQSRQKEDFVQRRPRLCATATNQYNEDGFDFYKDEDGEIQKMTMFDRRKRQWNQEEQEGGGSAESDGSTLKGFNCSRISAGYSMQSLNVSEVRKTTSILKVDDNKMKEDVQHANELGLTLLGELGDVQLATRCFTTNLLTKVKDRVQRIGASSPESGARPNLFTMS